MQSGVYINNSLDFALTDSLSPSCADNPSSCGCQDKVDCNSTTEYTSSETSEACDTTQYALSWHFKLIYVVAFVFIVVVATGGNAIVIWVVVAHKRMRTVINYFLVNLAVADALISVLNTLFNFAYMINNNWPFGRGYCRFAQFVAPCTISASVFTFMAIAVDRCVLIIQYIQYNTIQNHKSLKLTKLPPWRNEVDITQLNKCSNKRQYRLGVKR